MNWKLIEDKSWCSLEQQFEWVREMNVVPQDTRYHAEGSVAAVSYTHLDVYKRQLIT